VVLHGEPLEVPSFNAVLDGDVKVLYFPPPVKLQTGTTDKLMLSSSHTGPTMVKISPKPKVGKNSKERLAEVHENGNLKNRVGIHMCKIQNIEIKEATEKYRNGQGKPSDEERHKDNGFVGVLCRNGHPTPDLLRTQLFLRQNPSFHKIQEIRLRNDKHVVTGKWKLAIGINGRNDWSSSTLSLPLGGHRNLSGGVGRLENSENRETAEEKSKI
jgi:hypothetical protein